ncbi:hypothetical protein R5R35_005049 [Gryllus longicercus]|uniref:C2H2-type domain-containing protein n=1 Tax=Gryllus longicercus TaxID=2509291 RepID=A0AAN9Z8Q6_9ORTH
MENLEILPENIKIETVDELEDPADECTFNSAVEELVVPEAVFIKTEKPEESLTDEEQNQQSEDDVEDQALNFREGSDSCSISRDVKEEDHEEIEVKPPVAVFLDAHDEESNEDVEQDQGDPLALYNEKWGTELGQMQFNKRFHECSVCHKPFTHKSHLERHMRVHTGERPHECAICHKSFSQKSALYRHTRLHTGERPHVCTVCKKTFNEKGNLESHMRVHTGERHKKCSVCQMEFPDRSYLLFHMQVHTGERFHECSVCEKSFTQKSSLERHMQIHIGESAHECAVCQKSFPDRRTLDTHMQIHIGESSHQCPRLPQELFRQRLCTFAHASAHQRTPSCLLCV